MGRRSHRRAGFVSAFVAIAAGTLLLAGCGGSDRAASGGSDLPATAVGHPGFEDQAPGEPQLRTVLLFTAGPVAPSATQLSLNAQLVEGAIPPQTAVATVLTDTDCAPDGAGISHCRNELQLADGTRVVVRHPHDMSVIPCLTPGEQVRVQAA